MFGSLSSITSTLTAWLLHALSLDKTVQDQLRQELATLGTDDPSLEDLNSLRYLDCVVRETLRKYAPVSAINRVAIQEDVIPLEHPYTDVYGVKHSHIK